MKESAELFWPETYSKTWMKEETNPGLVSVIVPTYNRQYYVLEAISSVYAQTYRPIELIVIDDGSTDNTHLMIETWISKHNSFGNFWVRYLWQENRGVSAARNHGLVVSEGEYIQFLDSDDLLLPERISKCVSAINDQGVELVHSAHYLDYSMDFSEHQGRGIVISGPANMGKVPDPRFYIWTVAGFFLRKVLYKAGPWNESLRICEDAEYFSRVFAVAESAFAISEALVIKRKHGGLRLLNMQKEYDGLDNRYRCLELREHILESCGYDAKDLLGGWLQLAQDSLALGFPEICKKCLSHSKNMCQLPQTWIRWYLVKSFSYFPKQFGIKFWPIVNSIRNNLKWYLDMRKGKIKQVKQADMESNVVI